MKIVIDSAIPYIQGVLEPFADVRYIKGTAISHYDVRDADALVIRTRTHCNAALLDNSQVSFIATATIGFDHIDLDYCHRHNITVTTAAGCNARGVLQWVSAVLAYLSEREGWCPRQKTLGIVGVGHVGSLVKEYAESWGFRVVCCDPPREEREHCGFIPLAELARQSDIITFHTPLDDTTRHIADAKLFSLLPHGATLLNSSRGEVVDTQALAASGLQYVLDVWEQEPDLDPQVLQKALLATPHIAGYSAQGKANASSMAVEALARHFALPLTGWYPQSVHPSVARDISWEQMCSTIGTAFDIETESNYLKSHSSDFEQIRNTYLLREELY